MSHAEDEQLRQQATLPPATGAGEAGDAPSSASSGAAAVSWELDARPESIGRFKVVATLGSGGYGVVYKAHDPELRRDVAIKVPHRHRVAKPEDAEAYLAEAQIVASLDHPNIVPVYDVGRTEDSLCYVVSKFIEGSSLAARMQQSRPTHAESAELTATVAEALHYAHRKGLVHRDIKPGNILIEAASPSQRPGYSEETGFLGGKPFVVDFGLALREEDFGKGSQYAGTPAYMSPEQARGEGHRVDGRSDIFSLGVVFYELLTGRRPFRGDTPLDVQIAIIELDPRPLRQWDDAIPKELERICLKALAKRANDRYSTAKDLADDLRHFLASSGVQPARILANAATVAECAGIQAAGAGPVVAAAPPLSPVAATAGATSPQTLGATGVITPAPATPSDSLPIKIVPKGLRSFDAHDADFFLELLPGPRDRDGLPESIRFWKTRIEETAADATFPVGLVYGPSGCGKSSLVKAGLLPRLAPHVIAVYVEATATDTEARLLKAVRNHCPDLPAGQSLAETVAVLRRGRELPGGKKLVIVLDQFEQWLHANRQHMDRTELAAALRQADGRHVQFLLLIRDDFWLAISRLFQDLEIPLLEGQNLRLADLFDLRHARRVLGLFGQAYGCLPDRASELTADQTAFLDSVVEGLSEDGKVISVRVSLLADMMKGRAWTPASLRAVGGLAGIGVTFFEETFSARTASPEHRVFEKPVRTVLAALLPEAGTDIKGRMRPRAELLEASGLAAEPQRFERLLNILDSELRIITPTESLECGGLTPLSPSGDLLPDETEVTDGVRSAAAEKRRQAAALQSYQLTHDYLVPPLRQWLTQKQRETWRGRAELRLGARTAQWARTPESRFLPSLGEYVSIVAGVPRRKRTADQRRMLRAAGRRHGTLWGSVLAVLIAAGVAIQQYASSVRRESNQRRAESLVEAVLSAPPGGVPYTITNLEPLRDLALPLLRDRFQNAAREPSHRLHAALALAAHGEVEVDFLLDAIAAGPAGECGNILTALRHATEASRAASAPGSVGSSGVTEPRNRSVADATRLATPSEVVEKLMGRFERETDPAVRVRFTVGSGTSNFNLRRVRRFGHLPGSISAKIEVWLKGDSPPSSPPDRWNLNRQ